ncbi:MAG: hypothetical protein ACI9SC_001037 [Gammaproteobacteria bacterium]|jgi:hypothetical protein
MPRAHDYMDVGGRVMPGAITEDAQDTQLIKRELTSGTSFPAAVQILNVLKGLPDLSGGYAIM